MTAARCERTRAGKNASRSTERLDLYYAPNAFSPSWIFLRTLSSPGTGARTSASRGKPSTSQTTLQPDGNKGIWIEYEGARYYADGAAAVLSEARFTRIGNYRGFPVYRAADDTTADRIWVTSAIDGPIAPFVKR